MLTTLKRGLTHMWRSIQGKVGHKLEAAGPLLAVITLAFVYMGSILSPTVAGLLGSY